MLRTERMQKVRLLCLKKDRRAVVHELHMLGAIDLRRSGLQLSDGSVGDEVQQISDMLIRVGGAIDVLRAYTDVKRRSQPTPVKHMALGTLLERLGSYSQIGETYQISAALKDLDDQAEILGAAARVANALSGIDIDMASLRSDVLSFKAFEMSVDQVERLKSTIGERGISAEVLASRMNGKEFGVLVAYDKKASIDDVIKGIAPRELDITMKELHGKPKEAAARIARELAENAKRRKELQARLRNLAAENLDKLLALREMLEIELEKGNASSEFKVTESAMVIEGWVPRKRTEELESRLALATSGRFEMEYIEAGEDELAPTLVNRPSFLKPFDYLMEFLSLPRSDEIDPTWIFIISFPIFYGLMISDVGYGLASLLLSWYITRITDPDGLMYNTAKIWELGAISAVVFGVITNEYFGFQVTQLIGFQGIDWTRSITSILAITVLFGIVQVGLGIIFGIINARREHENKLVVSRSASLVTLVSGTLAIAGGFFGLMPAGPSIDMAVLAVAALLVTIIFGGREATEVTNLITHPLSYSRIMGFGMASIIIASLIDKAFTPNWAAGPLLFIGFLIIFIALHFLNMILSIFEGIVQAVRLNFVEFFTKFYKGGGIKFRPFGYRRVYTVDADASDA